eukprot:768772-Hanusia_phi.AAC.12
MALVREDQQNYDNFLSGWLRCNSSRCRISYLVLNIEESRAANKGWSGRKLLPELLFGSCHREVIELEVSKMLFDEKQRARVVQGYREVMKIACPKAITYCTVDEGEGSKEQTPSMIAATSILELQGNNQGHCSTHGLTCWSRAARDLKRSARNRLSEEPAAISQVTRQPLAHKRKDREGDGARRVTATEGYQEQMEGGKGDGQAAGGASSGGVGCQQSYRVRCGKESCSNVVWSDWTRGGGGVGSCEGKEGALGGECAGKEGWRGAPMVCSARGGISSTRIIQHVGYFHSCGGEGYKGQVRREIVGYSCGKVKARGGGGVVTDWGGGRRDKTCEGGL